ncbi:VrrA/YqfQ family protein [Lysinibacillus antri]|uniref:4-hydroxy-3-methylbut-2-enyl diphosphate reductase n=1 Tax=Lysinibacillus antri TaxID=2498145 RepID=A0A432LIY2_9BACI|nr:VrrA/YqfQ family protein [Lysinibacillus antri]RUL57023.1 hypothetical protein EK386_00975 [Lysinibacillus antri]
MRPSSFNHMPHGQQFNQFRGPGPGFGRQMPPPPGRFPPGMMPHQMPPQGFHQGFQQGQGQPGPPGSQVPPNAQSPKLDSFMNTANKWLATAQSFQPLIQQATPMLQNLPALWKLYKGFQSAPKTNEAEQGYDDFEEDYEEDYEPEYEPPRPQRRKRERQPDVRQTESRQNRSNRSTSPPPNRKPIAQRPSVPRIFQPPYDFD